MIANEGEPKRVVGAIISNRDQWYFSNNGSKLPYTVTLVLTGHGCFGEYVHRIGTGIIAECREGNTDINVAQNVIVECAEFAEQTKILTQGIERDFSTAAIVKTLLANDLHRRAVKEFCEKVEGLIESMEKSRRKTNLTRQARECFRGSMLRSSGICLKNGSRADKPVLVEPERRK